MTEIEMFERSFERPPYFFKLSDEEQWEIDRELGILDWEGKEMTDKDWERFKKHYKQKEDVL